MKTIILTVLLVAVSVNCYRISRSATDVSADTQKTLDLLDTMVANNEIPDLDLATKNSFVTFIKDYNRVYADKAEVAQRYAYYADSLKLVEQLNKSDKGSAVFEINAFADRSKDEKKSNLGAIL